MTITIIVSVCWSEQALIKQMDKAVKEGKYVLKKVDVTGKTYVKTRYLKGVNDADDKGKI